MHLVPPPNFSYLTVGERAALQDAFVVAGIVYDPPTREQLLDGVNRQFIANLLPIVGYDPVNQLASDLMRMNRVERLTDGTIPLAQWLSNAARRFTMLPQRALFDAALAKVTGTSATTVPSVVPADVPAVDFEEIITDGVDDLQDVSFLSAGAARLPAIAKLLVPRYENGQPVLLPDGSGPHIGAGTGWLIGSDLLVTNYHVVRNRHQTEAAPSDSDLRSQALGTQALFFYDANGDEGRKIGITELIAVGKEKTKDFVLLRLAEKANIPFLPIRDEEIKMPEPVQTPKGTVPKAFAVNIIQHPGGGPKRVALRNNLVFKAEYPTLHYFTDTLGGSSGSPVLDDTWRVVALHRAAVAGQAEFHGKMLGYVNQGIQIHAILAALGDMAKTDAQVASALKQIRDEQTAWTG